MPQMSALVVIAHPDSASFTHAAAQAAAEGLRRAGHHVDSIDLYAEGFAAAMSPAEHRAYASADPLFEPDVARAAELVGRAQILVFCYPTWWSGMPAIMKGWIERTLVQGVAFRFDGSGRLRPAMTHVRRLVGISTYGSSKLYVKAINDNGRRLVNRTVRLNTGLFTRSSWLALYSMDTATDAERVEFLDKVRTKAARW